MKSSLLSLVVLGAASAVASAQPSPAQAAAQAKQAFDANLAAYKQRTRAHFDRSLAGVDSARATPELAPLQPDDVPTSADRLTAAISTDVEGAEAGVTIAPAKLAGKTDSPWAGATLTVASLEDGGVRGGVGWSYDQKPSVGDLALSCNVDKVLEEADKLEAAYLDLCRQVPFGPYPTTPSDGLKRQQSLWVGAALACDRKDLIRGKSDVSIDELTDDKLNDMLFVRSRDLFESATGVAGISSVSTTTIKGWLDAAPSRTSCLDADTVSNAIAKALWDEPRSKFGFSVHGDFFPLNFGFKPDPDEELSRGELKEMQLHLKYEYSMSGTTFTLGVGGGYTRTNPDDELERTIAPSAGLRMLIARLDGESLEAATLDDEAPVFAIGFTASGKRTFDKPDNQETSWTEVEVTAFADFKVSKELAFRVGVPIKAEIETREADDKAMPPVVEKKGLQWTLPVFVATVLKL